jgi:hypothetical protein
MSIFVFLLVFFNFKDVRDEFESYDVITEHLQGLDGVKGNKTLAAYN